MNDEERMTDEERIWVQETLARRRQLKRGLRGDVGDMMADDKIKFEETQHQWREELCWLCARPWARDFIPYCSDKCKRGATIEMDEMKLGPGTPPLAKREQLRLFAKIINHQYAACSALFELITGYKPPKMKKVAAIISGH